MAYIKSVFPSVKQDTETLTMHLQDFFREIYHPKCPGDPNGRFVCDDFYRRLLLHWVHQRLLLGEICED